MPRPDNISFHAKQFSQERGIYIKDEEGEKVGVDGYAGFSTDLYTATIADEETTIDQNNHSRYVIDQFIWTPEIEIEVLNTAVRRMNGNYKSTRMLWEIHTFDGDQDPSMFGSAKQFSDYNSAAGVRDITVEYNAAGQNNRWWFWDDDFKDSADIQSQNSKIFTEYICDFVLDECRDQSSVERQTWYGLGSRITHSGHHVSKTWNDIGGPLSLKNLMYVPEWSAGRNAYDEYGAEGTLWNTNMEHWNEAFAQARSYTSLPGCNDISENAPCGSYIITVKARATHESYGDDNQFKAKHWVMYIPKRYFYDLMGDTTASVSEDGSKKSYYLEWNSSRMYNDSDYQDHVWPEWSVDLRTQDFWHMFSEPIDVNQSYSGQDNYSPRYDELLNFIIRISVPTSLDLSTYPIEFDYKYNDWPVWITEPYTLNNNFNPNKKVDWLSIDSAVTLAYINATFARQDFSVASNVYTSFDNNDYNIQRYYEDERRSLASALNNTNLYFEIAKTTPTSGPVEMQEDWVNSVSWGGGYKARVVQWGDEETLLSDDEIISGYGDLSLTSYPYVEVDSAGNPTDDNILSHVYLKGGTYEIKALVFSYMNHPIEDLQMAIRWKMVDTIVYQEAPAYQFEDFGNLGGYDYTTIPYPYTVPIISGISNESKYKQSLETLLKSGLFKDEDENEFDRIKKADENNELGDYLGKSNIEQTRLFLGGKYDMHSLLMIEPSNISDSQSWTPYTDTDWWDGEWEDTTFPLDSCVGTIYIDNNENRELVSDCIAEFNFGDVSNNTVRDSSGNGNKGILLGDYGLQKESLDQPVTRDSFINVAEVDNEEQAI